MYRPPDPSCLQNLAEHWPAYLIDLSGEPYSHMQWRFGNTCWSAETSGFTAIKALDAAQYDGTIMAYTFNPPLPYDLVRLALTSIAALVGVGYDWPLLTERAIIAARNIFGFILPPMVTMLVDALLPVDIFGSRLVLCYESISRVLNDLGWKTNPANYGPKDLLADPLFICRGQVEYPFQVNVP